jgi:hypothetical protein
MASDYVIIVKFFPNITDYPSICLEGICNDPNSDKWYPISVSFHHYATPPIDETYKLKGSSIMSEMSPNP